MSRNTFWQISPVAGALAIGSAITCLAVFSARAPRPAPAPGPAALARPRVPVRPVAFHPRRPVFPARRWLGVLPQRTPQPTVRVLLSEVLQEGRLRVTTRSGLLVIDADTHRVLGQVPGGKTYSVSMSDDGRAIAGPGGHDLPGRCIRLMAVFPDDPMETGSRSFLGALEITLGDSGLDVVNEVRREDYIAGVVAGEAAKSFPLEALKAQAVAARTYALSQRGHRGTNVDVVDTVADQVYTGAGRVWTECRQAVDATAGRILTWHGRPIIAYFSADCGGHTRTSSAAGFTGSPLPYLRAVPDGPPGGPAYCAGSPVHTWSAVVTESEILPKLREIAGSRLTGVTAIRASGHYSDGRTGTVEVDALATPAEPLTVQAAPPEDGAEAPTASKDPEPAGVDVPAEPSSAAAPSEPAEPAAASAEPSAPRAPEPERLQLRTMEFRKLVGLDILRSQSLTVRAAGPGAWEFQGIGYGHGVGLCQWGAAGMARQGIGFERILAHYYAGTLLQDEAPRHGTLEGIVRTAAGKPAANAVVAVAGTDRQARTDAKGRFRLTLPAATYDLIVLPAAGEPTASFAWSVKEGETTTARLKLD